MSIPASNLSMESKNLAVHRLPNSPNSPANPSPSILFAHVASVIYTNVLIGQKEKLNGDRGGTG